MRFLQTLLMAAVLWSQGLAADKASPGYGDNPEVGGYADVNGIRMYYKIYGKGQPLVMIHGNGASIGVMSQTIDAFRGDYRVIVADSRDLLE